jgi:hypothetical protein
MTNKRSYKISHRKLKVSKKPSKKIRHSFRKKSMKSLKPKNYALETVERRLKQYVRLGMISFLALYIKNILVSQEDVFDPLKIFKDSIISYSKYLKSNIFGSLLLNLIYVIFFGYIYKSSKEKFLHEKVYQRILKILNSTLIIFNITEMAYLMYIYKYDNIGYINLQKNVKSIIDYETYKKTHGNNKTYKEFMKGSEENPNIIKLHYDDYIKKRDDFIKRKILNKEDFENCADFKKLYRKLMLKYHPDKCTTDEFECEKITRDLTFFKSYLEC